MSLAISVPMGDVAILRPPGVGNRCLQSEWQLLAPYLAPVTFSQGDEMLTAGLPIERVVFPSSGLISVYSHAADGRAAEIALIGRNSMLGVELVMGRRTAKQGAVALSDGRGWSIEAPSLAKLLSSDARLQAGLLSSAQAFVDRVCQNLVIAKRGSIISRLASWLVDASTYLDSKEIRITHQILAVSLGVRRSGITCALHELEKLQAVKSTRGTIVIRDSLSLETLARTNYTRPVT